MIQRMQSVYLFLVFVVFVLMAFFPIAQELAMESPNQNQYSLYVYKFYYALKGSGIPPVTNFVITLPMLVVSCIIALMAIITIFLYKRRLAQMNMVKTMVFLNILLVVGIFFWYSDIIEKRTELLPSYDIGAYLPLISLVFLILAFRGIRKDERMVRAADRLR